MRKNVCIVVSLLELLACSFAFSQTSKWEGYYYEEITTDTLFTLRNATDIPFDESLVFPEYGYYSPSHANGLKIVKNWQGSHKISKFYEIDFKGTLSTRLNETQIYFNYYTSGIEALKLQLWDSTSKNWWSFEQHIDEDGFQKPLSPFLDNLILEDEDFYNKTGESVIPVFDRIRISVVGKEDAELVISDLMVLKKKEIEKAVIHPFFDSVLGNSHSLEEMKTYYKNPVIYKPSSDYIYGKLDGNIYLRPVDKNTSERSMLIRLLDHVIEDYQFYSERGLNRELVKLELRKLSSAMEGNDDCHFAQAMSKFVDTVYADPHFKISLATGCLGNQKIVSSPIRFYPLEGEFRVAAILDTIYHEVSLNDALVEIDGKDISGLSFSEINKLLKKPQRTEDSQLTLKGQNEGTYKVTVRYNRRPLIPKNFKRAQHAKFEFLEPNIVYLKLNTWDLDLHRRVVNSWEEVSHSDTWILDLRGNGGGEQLATLRMHSLFIDRPSKFASYSLDDELVTAPDTKYHFPKDKELILLVDNRTACASEAFIKVLEVRPNTTLIGSETTYGALSSRYDVHFPSGMTVSINCVNPKQKFDQIIEGIGIEPDIKISIDKIEDLFPYQDKVLQEAVAYATKEHKKDN